MAAEGGSAADAAEPIPMWLDCTARRAPHPNRNRTHPLARPARPPRPIRSVRDRREGGSARDGSAGIRPARRESERQRGRARSAVMAAARRGAAASVRCRAARDEGGGARVPRCDPGHDDAMALLLAAHSPGCRLLGVSTVSGNQSLAKTTANACKIVTVAGCADTVGVWPGGDGGRRRLARAPLAGC
eukprot:gene17427-2023_t